VFGKTHATFHVASFACDGDLVDAGIVQVSTLSPRWLSYCREVLEVGGSVFSCALPAPFERLRLRFTSACGAALVTFSDTSLPIASSAFLRGDDRDSETEVLGLFVDSLRRTEFVRRSQATSQPFAKVFAISERPLHVAVPWGTSSEELGTIVATLGNHLAGVFLCEKSLG
jgi:hypothetical protein